MSIRRTDLAYLAGFFDGEGSLSLSLNESGGIRFTVACSQNTRTVLDLYVRHFGGSVYGYTPKGRRSEMFSWRVNAQKAYDFLVQVRSFLLVKLVDADTCMSIWEQREDRLAMAERVDEYNKHHRIEKEAR
jgi:hypothetical protein